MSENKLKYDNTYHKVLKYGAVAFLVLILIELLAYVGWFKLIPEFFTKYGIWLLYLNISVVSISMSILYVLLNKTKVPCMTGMMIGMTIGMQIGMMIGAVIGATNGYFTGAMAGMILGSIGGIIAIAPVKYPLVAPMTAPIIIPICIPIVIPIIIPVMHGTLVLLSRTYNIDIEIETTLMFRYNSHIPYFVKNSGMSLNHPTYASNSISIKTKKATAPYFKTL